MGYLMMCVLPFLCPRGTLSTWCVERAVVAATLQGVPRARQCGRVVRLLCMVIRPPDPVATDRAGRRRAHAASWQPRVRPRWKLDARWIVDALPRRPAAVDLARPGRANGHPADQGTRKRLERSRTMWETEDALQQIRAEGRAIDPAAVERMFDATRGAHISPGELERIWRGPPGPPADRAWLSMAAQVDALLDAFPAFAAHDQLQGVTLVGRVRTDLSRCYGEDDLFGSGHPPETVVALTLASHAFKTGRRPSDATPAGAPAGGTR